MKAHLVSLLLLSASAQAPSQPEPTSSPEPTPAAAPATPPAPASDAAPATPSPFPETVQRALDEAVRAEFSRGPHAGLSVGVQWKGQRWEQGYGLRDLAHHLPATPRTTYRMASITKSFTAMAVLQLVREGKLDLDADIQTLVPAWSGKEWPSTVRQLLGHLGGVPHDNPHTARNVRHVDTAGAIALFSHKPLVAEPGTQYVYSTWGYNLLGAAVERASGEGYGAYLQHHIFAPTGMSHAAMDDYRTRDAEHAHGYRTSRGQVVPSHYLDVSSRFAGGGTRASVEDLLAFGEALLDYRLVPEDTTRLMQTSMSTRAGELTDYGMGFATYPLRGHYVVAHAGAQPETSTLLFTLPAEGVVIALATNLEDDARALQHLASRLVEVLLEQGQVHRDAAAVDAVDAGVHEGLARLFTYGLAYHSWATRGPGTLPEPGELPEAFTQMSGLLERAAFVQDPKGALERLRAAHQPRSGALLIRVGTRMARTLEEAYGPEKLREYPARGPLAFFTDYLAACEKLNCPAPLRFSEGVQADARRLEALWKASQVEPLTHVRLDEVKDPESLVSQLEKSTVDVALHPDYAEEMLRVATRWGKQGQKAEQRQWLERAVAAQPRSEEARKQLTRLRGK